jgi:hypothetical protein
MVCREAGSSGAGVLAPAAIAEQSRAGRISVIIVSAVVAPVRRSLFVRSTGLAEDTNCRQEAQTEKNVMLLISMLSIQVPPNLL